MERVITCPNCFDNDKCFEDMQEEFNSYLCFSCGYMSDSRYKKDSINLVIINLKAKGDNTMNQILSMSEVFLSKKIKDL